MKQTIQKIKSPWAYARGLLQRRIKNHRLFHHSFTKYTLVGTLTSLFTVFALWLLIDVFGIPTIISSTAVVVVAFFLKYFLYKLIGFVRDEQAQINPNDHGA